MKKCTKCGEIKSNDKFSKDKVGLYPWCKECIKYNEDLRNKSWPKTSMYENKDSSLYLGIVVGERLCRHLFNDVEVMPMHNPGFDIICNQGKKIDVKTSALTEKRSFWNFSIRKNKTADYFLCVAFDNRKDLNPLHMWMIPGEEVNDKHEISIRSSTVHKWKQWERDIDNVQLCCTTMKKG